MAAYVLSLIVAAAAFFGSVFFKEITRTYHHQLLGISAHTLWQCLLYAIALLWLLSFILSLICMKRKSAARRLGVASLGINLATALLTTCTLI